MKGELFILSSPAGVGKTTVAEGVVKEVPKLKRVITCTTRKPRKGERDGVDYYFLSKEEFEERIKKGKFLEYAVVHGNYYGTPLEEIERELEKGYDLLLVIDVQGMRQILKSRKEAITIFLLPPSLEELKKRMEKRGDPPEEIKKRLETAKKEIPAWREYDFVVVNDVLMEAKEDVKRIILAQRLKSYRFDPQRIKDPALRELMGL
ncbi:MAG: guanylate kinase [Aquificae bacterium]|nr:guanylate kinase [Aquificota bacterium]